VPCITTLSGILAAIHGVEALRRGPLSVRSLQEHQAGFRADIAALDAATSSVAAQAPREVSDESTEGAA
jgi:hypothetical protein